MVNAETAGEAIEHILHEQVNAWNRGDLSAFVEYYAEQCTLVGKEISVVTRAQVLSHYQKKYSSRAAMGQLTFSNLTINSLGDQATIVTGNWHLDRDAAEGGPTGGVFSLVLKLNGGKWKIVLDHTS
jgi:uncharacterized protein (TIGR02246 family)